MVLEIDGETCFDHKKVPSSFNLFHTESSTFQNFYRGKHVQDDEFMLIPVNDDFIYK